MARAYEPTERTPQWVYCDGHGQGRQPEIAVHEIQGAIVREKLARARQGL